MTDDAGVPIGGNNCASGHCGSPKLLGSGHGQGLLNHKKNWQSVDDGIGASPHEGQMFSHPPHKVAPPDILLINMVRMIPRAPYRLSAMETLAIQVTDTLPNQPISGMFTISPEGSLNLGFSYGVVRIGGLTVDQAQIEIRKQLGSVLRNPQVNVTLVGFKNMEQIRGEHLVRPDGTISLGSYGSVYVAGLSLGQAKCVIERYLEAYFQDPVISLDVFAYNSRFYYIIVDGAGFGQQVFRFPITGNETVLDAISNINGLASVSSKHRIWLSRPAPEHLGCIQVMPIDWNAVTMNASVRTNYQLFPGDRIYIDGAPLIKIDNFLTKLLNPINQVFSTMFLGSQAVQSLSGSGSTNAFVPIN